MSVQNLQPLLTCRRVLVAGRAVTPLERRLAAELRESAEALDQADRQADLARAAVQAGEVLLVVFGAALVDEALIETLGAGGCRGVLWVAREPVPPSLLQAARPHRLRFLGARSAGFFHTQGLRAAALPLAQASGSLALIAQSGSIAAAAADWAAGRGIGFSWAVTTGAEDDADIADFLDVAALDPATRAVVLQVGRIGAARKFMSAARACARLKPVVVLQSRIREDEGQAGPDAVRSAAFARAGLVECQTLDGLFDALAAFARLPARPQTRVLTLGAGAGICALGVDAVLRHGLTAANCGETTLERMREAWPRLRPLPGSMDLGSIEPAPLVAVCRAALDDPAVDYLLLVLSPALEGAHDPYVEAVLGAELGPRLVTVWLGLESASAARRRSTAAGLATFVTAGQAARALRYRWLHGRTRELLMQTPPPREPSAFDPKAAAVEIEAALARGELALDDAAVDRLLDAYAIPAAGAGATGTGFVFGIERHAELGVHLTVAAHCGLLRSPVGLGFPPLDPLLARRMLEALEVTFPPQVEGALRRVLYALSQLALEQMRVRRLSLTLALCEAGGLVRAGRAEVALDPLPPAERLRLALAPYPTEQTQSVTLRNGRRYRIRAILPEDEPALVALLESVRPEDIRLRFFTAIRHFSHEMAARMTQIDYDRELVLTVECEDGPPGLWAIAHLISDPDGERGEYAVLVHHEHANAGLGRKLMEALLVHARRRGLSEVYGEVLAENRGMLALVHSLGFDCRTDPNDPRCRYVSIRL